MKKLKISDLLSTFFVFLLIIPMLKQYKEIDTLNEKMNIKQKEVLDLQRELSDNIQDLIIERGERQELEYKLLKLCEE